MILVFGSINVDVVVPVPHLPAVGETVLGGDYALFAGCKGANQALAACRAGAEVVMAGAVGHDDLAAVALAPLNRAGVDTGLVRRTARPTGCALIMVSAAGENLIAVASGANVALTCDHVPEERIALSTTLIAQMEVPPAETGRLIRRIRAAGGRTILNFAPALALDRGLLGEIDLVVANEGEAAGLGAEPQAVGRMLRHGFVVTAGAAGAVAYLAGGARLAAPALPIVPVDTTGAGDTFVGALAAALDQRASLAIALRRANAAAGLACLALGAQTAMPDRAAIDAAEAQLPR